MARPWIGERWGDAENLLGGVKLLILGESTHAQESPIGASPENFLIDTVKQFLEHCEKWRFYSVLTAFVANKELNQLTPDDRQTVWASVAFFNYVPGVAAQFSRERPTDAMFEAGAEPFLAFVRCYSPEAVLVCGKCTWYWLLKGLGYEGRSWETPFYDVNGISMTCVTHPSAGFSYGQWRPVLDELLDRARTRKNSVIN